MSEGRRSVLASPWTRGVLQAVAVATGGFLLLYPTLVLAHGFHRSLKYIFYRGQDLMITVPWVLPLQEVLFVILVVGVSWIVLRLRLDPLTRAILITVPTTTVLVTVGMLTYQWPFYRAIVSVSFVVGTLVVFARTRQPWLYWYSVILVALALAGAVINEGRGGG